MCKERALIDSLLSGAAKPDDLFGSTSELLCVWLAVGRFEELRAPYETIGDAWERLDLRQRNIVREYNKALRTER